MVANDSPKQAKDLLLTQDSAGLTPLQLANDASGESDSGPSALKLMLLSYLQALNAMDEMFEMRAA